MDQWGLKYLYKTSKVLYFTRPIRNIFIVLSKLVQSSSNKSFVPWIQNWLVKKHYGISSTFFSPPFFSAYFDIAHAYSVCHLFHQSTYNYYFQNAINIFTYNSVGDIMSANMFFLYLIGICTWLKHWVNMEIIIINGIKKRF